MTPAFFSGSTASLARVRILRRDKFGRKQVLMFSGLRILRTASDTELMYGITTVAAGSVVERSTGGWHEGSRGRDRWIIGYHHFAAPCGPLHWYHSNTRAHQRVDDSSIAQARPITVPGRRSVDLVPSPGPRAQLRLRPAPEVSGQRASGRMRI